MLRIIHRDKDPEFCVITPLKIGDNVSRETKISVKRNKTKFIWATFQAENNVAKNFKLGLEELKKQVNLPEYTIKIDSDTIWNRNTLDSMVGVLKNSHEKIAYSYVSFEYQGKVNKAFPADDFNPMRLRQMNYISSNSLFKTEILEKIHIIDDEKYKRLLDWTYFLHLLNNGYVGTPSNGYFIARSSSDSVSSGNIEDFKIKYARVVRDFVKK